MSPYRAKFLNYTEIPMKNIYAADRRTFKALGKGDIQISAMSATLVSIAKVTNGKLIGQIPRRNGLYQVNHGACDIDGRTLMAATVSIDELHRKMGHIAYDAAKALVQKGMVKGIELDESPQPGSCDDSCEYAKATRKPIRKVRMEPRAEHFGDEIHSDTDGCTRWSAVDILRTKDETLASYKRFEAWAKTQREARIKCCA
jgi:hypothetical protein